MVQPRQTATIPSPGLRAALPLPGEEVANAITHGVGALLALGTLVALVMAASREGDPWRVATLTVFGVTLVATYLFSTLYHLARRPRSKARMRMLDHVCIYLLIAGTYTPITIVTLGGGWGWTLFLLIWTLALIGVVFKVFTLGRFERASLALFLAMGWLAVIAASEIVRTMTTPGLLWLIAGGVAYSSGVVFYRWRRMPYNHAIWHVFVMIGSACHVGAMWSDVLPGG